MSGQCNKSTNYLCKLGKTQQLHSLAKRYTIGYSMDETRNPFYNGCLFRHTLPVQLKDALC